jgi:hypothetical protein
MRRMLFGVAMAVLCAAAWGGPPVLVPDSNMHEKVVPLSDLSVVPMRLTNCNVLASPDNINPTRTCDLPLNAFTVPIVLREVQVYPGPYGEQSGQLFWAAQCYVRVQFSEDGLTFKEVAQFAWPPGDFHSINHVLPVPISLRPSSSAVLRAIVGLVSLEPDECRVTVKVYNSKL